MISPNITSRPVAVIAIIKLNIAVFVLWYLALMNGSEIFMFKNFLVSWTAVQSGRVWTLVTSVFSHNMLFHILINMYVFFGFGSVLENLLGMRRFLIFYLMAGILASLGHCFVSTFFLQEAAMPALGASGAIAGVIVLFSFVFPHEKLLLMGIIPLPAYFAAILFVGMDVYGLISQTQGSTLPIGYGAHLGGALYGILYYFLSVRKKTNTISFIF